MKQLNIPFLKIPGSVAGSPECSKFLDSLKREKISEICWPVYGYKPEVAFAIAHNGEAIFLKYYVAEKETRTAFTEINDPVYRDSCVEFFVSLDNGLHYYNLEFNSKGVCLAQYGSGRQDRNLLPESVISEIEKSTRRTSTGDGFYWELCLKIPQSVFCYDEPKNLTGKSVLGNFYKCGDDLEDPHFVVWNPISSEEPDFHLPEYFGRLSFASAPVSP